MQIQGILSRRFSLCMHLMDRRHSILSFVVYVTALRSEHVPSQAIVLQPGMHDMT